MHRGRQMDSLQGFISSFKQFEKKLDKLQADVSHHGNTLSELRSMVAGLSTGVTSNTKLDDSKRKTVGLQWESTRLRRPVAVRPLPNKIKAKSFVNTKSLQGQKYGLAKPSVDLPFRAPKKMSMPAVANLNHRARKAEAPRKATKLRPKNAQTRNKLRK